MAILESPLLPRQAAAGVKPFLRLRRAVPFSGVIRPMRAKNACFPDFFVQRLSAEGGKEALRQLQPIYLFVSLKFIYF